MIILWEGNVYVEFVADIAVFELRLKARDELAGAKLQAVLFRLAAVERNAVDAALKIEHQRVAVLRSAVCDIDLAGVSVLHGL